MKLLTVLAALFVCSTATVVEKDALEVAFFYESYCPYCVQYVEDQLIEVYKLFVDHLQLQLVPYGNADQRFVEGHWEFDCQHGPKECLANKLHGCAIYQLCGDSGTVSCAGAKVSQVLTYISCVMKHQDQLKATAQCARTSKLDADKIISCAKGDQGDQLLNLYGNMTEEYAPWKQAVPAVAVNGDHDEAAEENLMKRLCQLKPSVCSRKPEVVLV